MLLLIHYCCCCSCCCCRYYCERVIFLCYRLHVTPFDPGPNSCLSCVVAMTIKKQTALTTVSTYYIIRKWGYTWINTFCRAIVTWLKFANLNAKRTYVTKTLEDFIKPRVLFVLFQRSHHNGMTSLEDFIKIIGSFVYVYIYMFSLYMFFVEKFHEDED